MRNFNRLQKFRNKLTEETGDQYYGFSQMNYYMTHKEKLEEIEHFLSYRKRELESDIRFYIEQEEAGKLGEEGKIYQQVAEGNMLFVEELGNRFFNWE